MVSRFALLDPLGKGGGGEVPFDHTIPKSLKSMKNLNNMVSGVSSHRVA
jgi:hypothetical protein